MHQRPSNLHGLLGLLLLGVGCGAEPDLTCSELSSSLQQPIKVSDPLSLVDLPELRTNILRLDIVEAEDASARGSCTGARIAPGVALTAKHCVRSLKQPAGTVWRPRASGHGSGCGAERLTPFAIGRVSQHPDFDLAIVTFEEPLAEPKPHLQLEARPAMANDRVIMTGYGLTEDSSLGQLRAIRGSVISNVEDAVFIVVQGEGGGACVGDSGGPLLRVGSDDDLAVLGTLSRGSASCLGRDEYVRVDLARSWLDARAPSLQWAEHD